MSLIVNWHDLHKTDSVEGSKDGAVVRALVSHQCDRPGLIPGVGVMHSICGLSLLLVLSSLPCWFCSRYFSFRLLSNGT